MRLTIIKNIFNNCLIKNSDLKEHFHNCVIKNNRKEYFYNCVIENNDHLKEYFDNWCDRE